MALFDRSFLITTGITAVICGAILYYINTRMRELELALAKQNQVLSSFIANVQQEFRLSSTRQQAQTNVTSLASDEAIKFVENMEKKHEKIIVSDSDDESVSDDDESISDDDESISDDDVESVKEISQNKIIICDLSQVIDLNAKVQPSIEEINIAAPEIYTPETHAPEIYTPEIYTPEIYTPDRISDDDASDDESDSESELEYEHVLNSSYVEEIHVEKLDLPVETKIDDIAKAEAKLNLNDLKVDDLRKLALDKKLTTKEEAKKLKKNELLALLKK